MEKNRYWRLDSIPQWDWCRENAAWCLGFSHLQVFAAQNGNSRVTREHRTRNGFRLGQWVNRTRTGYRNRSLSSTQIQLLEALPGWQWSVKCGRWERLYAEFRREAEKRGDCRVSRELKNSDGGSMRRWYHTQRSLFPEMNPLRQQLLRELPGWDVETPDQRWENGYRVFLDYVDRAGDGLVPRNHVTDDGFHLGQWVSSQRHKNKTGRLCAGRRTRLSAHPNWVWDATPDLWEEGYRRLSDYTRDTGNSRPEGETILDDGHRLSHWVRRQRQSYANGELSADRVTRLESLPGWVWSVRDTLWEQGFEHLVAYVVEFGGAGVVCSYTSPDKFKLGIWVKTQRGRKSQGKLSARRERRLEALPGWKWSTLSEKP